MKDGLSYIGFLTLPLSLLCCGSGEKAVEGDGGMIPAPEPPAVTPPPGGRPNIVFAFGDDFGRYASIYADIEGDPICRLIETPNIDRIGREGVVFTNAHVPAPSSTPCRSSILSGRYFWNTGKGVILFGAEWDESIPSYPLELEKSGYHIGYTYKAWGPGVVLNAPYGGGRNQYRGAGNKFNDFSMEVSAASDKEKRKAELYAEVAANFEQFLDARGGEGQPFCYWWGPTNTHRDWEQGSGRALWGIDPSALTGIMPGGIYDNATSRGDFADYLGECMAFDTALGEIISILEERGELDHTVFVVSGDHGVPGFPRAKCNLYDLGTRVALMVRYPVSVPGGRVVDDFVNLMDLAPTFLEFGGTAIPVGPDGRTMDGRSIKDILEQEAGGLVDPTRDYAVTGRERHVHDARDGNLPYPQRAIVVDGWKYIRNFKPDRYPAGRIGTGSDDLKDIDPSPTKRWYKSVLGNSTYEYWVDLAFGLRPYEELYDLKADPHETENLAAQERYRAKRDELSARLDRVLGTYADPRMKQEVVDGLEECIFDTPYFTSLTKAD